MKIGYARVSTRDQNLDGQLDALRAAGCERIYTDKASGKLASRPELDKALAALRAGDQLVITRLDRLGRSLKHLIAVAESLREQEMVLVVTEQGIDTSTAAGRMFFHMLGAVAEFERDLIAERTRDGLEAARSRGRKRGVKAKLSDRQIALVRQHYEAREMTVQQIADDFRVSRATIYRVLEAP